MANPVLSADSQGAKNSNHATGAPRAWAIGLAGLGIVLAGLVAYSNSLGDAFIFDDGDSILRNGTILHGWWAALRPPVGTTTVSGRPLVNLSVALNYQWGGFNVRDYHLFNILIQLLAGLTLFGVVRRTLRQPVLQGRYQTSALPLAFIIALLWTVHPLQTESVTYVIQRAESMMGLFYLLTVYCFIRGVESARAWVWYSFSVAACLLGMITKETMVTAPLMLLLYDRTFVAGTFAGAWRQRGKVYAALAGTWLPLAWLVTTVSWPENAILKNPAMDSLGLAMRSFAYALKQCEAIVQYLWLSFWPHLLNFSYGKEVINNPREVAPQIVALTLLLGAAVYALWKKSSIGFLGAWFFVILAPTSSVVPLRGQTMAEHHLYLSLAAVLALAVLGLHALLGPRVYTAGLGLALALGALTFGRNHDYRTNVSIWSDVVEKFPYNRAAHVRLTTVLEEAGPRRDAIAHYAILLQSDPGDANAENNLGADLNLVGRPAEAVIHLQRSIALEATAAEPHYNLGNAYSLLNEPGAARDAYLGALRINQNYAEAHNNLGNIYLLNFGEIDQAILEFEAALRADPDFVWAEGGLGDACMRKNLPAEAIPHYAAAIRLKPDNGPFHLALGDALLAVNRVNEAILQDETAVRLMPDNPAAREHLEQARQRAQQATPPLNGAKQ